MIYALGGITSLSDKDRVHWTFFSGFPKVSGEMPEVQTDASKNGWFPERTKAFHLITKLVESILEILLSDIKMASKTNNIQKAKKEGLV